MNRIKFNELEYVEEPFLRQLERLGWTIVRAGEDGKGDPAVTFRESFQDFILEEKLRLGLKRVNPWLEKDQVAPVVRELTNPGITGGLIEHNRYMLEKLLENTSAENRVAGRPEAVKFIDFSGPDKNEFLAIAQFKINIPGTERHIIPDIVLFINGLPVGVVECKSAYLPDPMGEGIEQLMRYQNRRGEAKEGNEKLFWYNQLVIATSRQVCRYSSITGAFEHFVEWKDPYPYSLGDIQTGGSDAVTSQNILIQGMLAKENLLDMIRSFIIFQENDKGKLIKIVPRYQQYRTVGKILKRFSTGASPVEKGGIVWHTQGSGKSLTMLMAVRKMYHENLFSGYKVVFVTDRKDLERQLKETTKSIGYSVHVANNIARLKSLLSRNTPDLVMGMIHKFQEREVIQEFPVLNESEEILVMIDEAHRSQYKYLGANLNKSLPHAVKIAFTGTPIDKTEESFGEYIDKYSIRQAVEDGVTVEIIYEGRAHKAFVNDPDAFDQAFMDVFPQAKDDPDAQEQIKRREWVAYLEAESTVQAKAEDMLRHYLTHIFPNRFKAQVVAVSRVAAIRYKKALDALLADHDWINACLESLKREPQIQIKREQLTRLKAEVIISGSPNDPPDMRAFTEEQDHDRIIDSFKLPFGKQSESGQTGDVGILIVQSMLLTGFDAPVEQVMYLDRVVKEHNLLQAIARVNRMEKNKHAGFIVDYVGVAKHLREALANFEDKDVEEILRVVKDEGRDLDELYHAKAALEDFFKKYDIDDVHDVDVCVDVLADDEAKNDFLSLFRQFSAAMDKALPKAEALKFVHDLKRFSFISQVARNRYRDEKFSLKNASQKIRGIVDQFLESRGIDPKVSPLPIFSEKFKTKLQTEQSPRAKAEELRYGIAQHIERHQEEDPELYERFSEKLARLLKEYKDNWELMAKELEELLEEIRQGREAEEHYGFDRKTELPFLALIKKEVFNVKDMTDFDQKQKDLLVQVTQDILERIKSDVQLVGFWDNISAQKKLRGFIASHLLTAFRDNNAIFKKRIALSQKITELAYHIYG
jgi:type I restriction enzyme R subunit